MESMDLDIDDSLNTQDEPETEYKGIRFELDVFSGPLDLLLFLVKQHKIDIYDIPIAEITDKYLQYLNEMLVHDLDDLTDFYKTAAWLLLIKSRALLPVHVDMDDEEIDTLKNELVNTLIEYQKYRKLSDMLATRYEQFNWLSLRQESNTLPLDLPKDNIWKEVDTLELFSTFMKIMDKPDISQRIIDLNEPVNINQKIVLILEKLEIQHTCSFDEIVAGGGVLSVVCTLLALLELMKQQQVRAMQHVINGEIKIFRGTIE